MLTVGNIQSSSFRPLKVQVRIGLLRRSDSDGGAPSGQLQTGRDELRNVVHVALREQVRGTGLESAIG